MKVDFELGQMNINEWITAAVIPLAVAVVVVSVAYFAVG